MADVSVPAWSHLVEILDQRAAGAPDQVAYLFRDEAGRDDASLSYGQLAGRARAVAAELLRTTAPGERALLLYRPGLDFLVALFGCLYAGVVAVPAYPPRGRRSLPRLAAILADSQAAVALTDSPTRVPAGESWLGDELRRLRWIHTAALPEADEPGPAVPIGAETVALLQYTSGSTGQPRGAILSHRQILHNSQHISRLFGTTAQSRSTVWLPPFHDMGLIGGVVQPLYAGFPMTLMSPTTFLQSPYRWLETIAETGSDVSGGPNFAYELCLRRISQEQRAELDLSGWRVAFNGAEPIRPETIDRFAEYFAPCGFRRSAFLPCYGLAEATLLVSGGPAVVRTFDRAELERGRVAPASGPAGQALVGSGRGLPDQVLRIVDPDTGGASPAGAVGEVWVAGTSVARGYWNRPEESADTFGARVAESGDGPFLRTGDLGFLDDGELFVTGRIKDLIVIRGRNHHPHDIERTVEGAHPVLRPGCGAAFPVEAGGEERLVLVYEAVLGDGVDPEQVAGAVRREVAAAHGLHAHAVVLIRPGSVPRTSSGKIQRHRCRADYLAGRLTVVGQSTVQLVGQGATQQDAAGERVVPPEPARLRAAAPPARRRLVEAYLRAQAAAVLRVDGSEVPLDRPLNELGLDSLAATMLQHRIEEDLHTLLPLADIVDGASVAALAERLVEPSGIPGEAGSGGTSSDEADPGEADPGEAGPGEAVLSVGQRSMWFLQRLAPASAAYTISCAVRIPGDLDPAALRHAFAALVDRHAILRTSYPARGGEPVAVVRDRVDGWFREHDATGWDDGRLHRALADEADEPFDLESGPVLRVAVFRRGPREHVLLLAVHHIAADLWSLEILLGELGTLYQAGGTGPAEPARVQHQDYARWQQRLLAGPEGERLWTYWRGQLAGDLPVLRLPLDRPRPPERTYAGAVHPFRLGTELTARLRALAAERGVTLFTVLLAGYQALLHRYTGQDDIVVGSSLTGRGRAAFGAVVGYLVNMVPLRADLSGEPTFAQLLGDAWRTVLGALAHQDCPFPEMVARLGVRRDASVSPVFQTAFTFQQARLHGSGELAAMALAGPGLRGRLGPLPVESVGLRSRTAQFDLSLHLAEVDGGLAGSLTYRTALFDAETIARIAGHLEALLSAAVEAPDRRVSALPLAPAGDRRPGPPGRPDGDLVHRLFEAQVARTPDRVAVVDGDREVTYRDLNQGANRLARHLRSRGIGDGAVVGVLLDPGAEQVLAVLAVLKTGAGYLPLDPGHPPPHRAHLLGAAAAAAVVTRGPAPDLPSTVAVVDLDADGPAIAGEPADDLAGRAFPGGPSGVACVGYTSGSTGRPKGVMMTHAGLVAQMRALSSRTRATADDRYLLVEPLAAASSVRQLTVPLCAGGAVVPVPRHRVTDVPALFELIRRHGVTVVSATPSFWRHSAEALDRLPAPRRDALLDNQLRLLLSASETLHADLPQWWLARLRPGVRMVNLFGHTEISGIATSHQVPPSGESETPGAAVPAGTPLPGIDVYVLDDSMSPVPPGVAGEVYVGGPSLARGYLDRPDLTAERFLPDPFGERPGGRLYRTGDLARYLPSGDIAHLGRRDDQVKVRGHRIEPAEVAAVLAGHPAVRDAAVLAGPDDTGQTRLVAYVVAEPAPTTSELRRHVADRLPEYMVPAVVLVLPVLPRTVSGKVDRRALPAPERQRPALDGEFTAAVSPLEETLAGIWAEVLGVERVGVHDNFFDAGGNSLSLARAHQRMCETLEIELEIVKLFQYPTVRALAEHLSQSDPRVSTHLRRSGATAAHRRERLEDLRARRQGGTR
ncbi:amino acid adenylation domain-containing protein [Plantactinospora sp. CA-294935]|uniref:amino acid adenylation domain-containing protein n=1 Tax=Plantactinospora sp. CA-294935 TaxID=3240012 RepID=UPI003D922C88